MRASTLAGKHFQDLKNNLNRHAKLVDQKIKFWRAINQSSNFWNSAIYFGYYIGATTTALLKSTSAN